MFCFIDIDGTIADTAHRDHYIKTEDKPKDWVGFYKLTEVAQDTVVEGAKLGLQHLARLGYDICFITGRHEVLRDTTVRWLLEKLDINVLEERLLMRPDGNLVTAAAFKREQVLGLLTVHERGPGVLFIDNDPNMGEVYGEFGLVLKAPDCWKVMFPVLSLET